MEMILFGLNRVSMGVSLGCETSLL
jgi:hypothetical protein